MAYTIALDLEVLFGPDRCARCDPKNRMSPRKFGCVREISERNPKHTWLKRDCYPIVSSLPVWMNLSPFQKLGVHFMWFWNYFQTPIFYSRWVDGEVRCHVFDFSNVVVCWSIKMRGETVAPWSWVVSKLGPWSCHSILNLTKLLCNWFCLWRVALAELHRQFGSKVLTEWLRTGTFYSKNPCPQGRW